MTLNLLKNSDDLTKVDWDQIVESITRYSVFDSTKDKIIAPPIQNELTHIINEYSYIDFFIENIDYYEFIHSTLTSIPNNSESFMQLQQVKKGKILEASQLNFVCLILESFGKLYKNFKHWQKYHDIDIDLNAYQSLRAKFLTPLRKFLGTDGQFIYENHPELSKLHKKQLKLEESIRSTIHHLMRDNIYKNALQFDQFDIVNDHYVFPIRSDSYKSNMGSIIARSSTGMTLFVSPIKIKQMSNDRILLINQIEEIINKICIEYTEKLKVNFSTLYKTNQFILDLDYYSCISKYFHEMNFSRPIFTEKNIIDVNYFFHPLIERPVTNSMVINKDKKGLIISGPNTGGKTVTLKSILLINLFIHKGFFVPAEKITTHFYKNLYYFGHDQQSLQEGLSSFSSEVKTYLNLMKELDDSSLLVIDEIFNSTSSEDASALTIGLLDVLHEKNDIKSIISTHHQVLKTYMHTNNDFISSHVGFDMDKNLPTYKLNIGEPGSSMAFSIFENLSTTFNIENKIVDKAKNFVSNNHINYEKLLQDISYKKGNLDKLILENNKIKADLKNQKSAMEGQLQLQKDRILKKYKEELDQKIKQAENIKRELKLGKIKSVKEADKKIQEVSASIKRDPSKSFSRQTIPISPRQVEISEIKIGETYFCEIFKKDITITSINYRKNEVQITSKGSKIWVPLSTLSTTKVKQVKTVSVHYNKQVSGLIEIDCRGYRLEEFQTKVETAIYEVINGDIPFLNIIHGHGDGVLKKWLRSEVKSHKELSWTSGEGNDGETKIQLKEN